MFDDKSPIYRQIAEGIRQDIVSGALGEEEQVMSTNQYATFYRINPATAQKAFQELVDEGLLYKKRGIGMFVNPGAQESLLADRRDRFFEESVVPMIDEARTIGMPIGDVVERIRAYCNGEGN